MKKVLLIAIMFGAAAAAKCQDLVFNMNQSGQSYKSAKNGAFIDAEVKDTKATIILKNNQLIVNDGTNMSYTLIDKLVETKISDNVVMYSCNGRDEKKFPMSFQYTVNRQSKEAIVELASKKLKTYYFGTFSSSDLTKQP